MSDPTEKNVVKKELPILPHILLRLGMVLEKTKEALIADLKRRWPENSFSPDKLSDYIDQLFQSLGYNLEDLAPEEVEKTLQELLSASENLGDILTDFAELSKFVRVINEENGDGLDETAIGEDIKDLFIGTYNLFNSIKALGQIDPKEDLEEWEEFLQESNFAKELPKRLLDHILASFMENVCSIFSEEINDIGKRLKKQKDTLPENIQIHINRIVTAIEKSATLIETDYTQTLSALSQLQTEILNEITALVNEELDLAVNNKLKKDIENLELFIKVMRYFAQVFAILKFTKLIAKEKVEVFSLQQEIAGNEENIVLTTELWVLHWDRVKELIEDPIGYFEKQYGINRYTDAVEIIKLLLALTAAFGLDIPDFSSLKKMLLTMLVSMKEQLKEDLKTSPLKEQVEGLIKFIKYVLSVIERVGIETKNQLNSGLNHLLTDINYDIRAGFDYIKSNGQTSPPSEAVEKAVEKVCLSDESEDHSDFLTELLLYEFQKRTPEYEQFVAITEEDWKKLIAKIGAKTTNFQKQVNKAIRDYISKEPDADLVNELATQLAKELAEETRDLPDNWEDFVRTLQYHTEDLSPEALVSHFDFFAYFQIVSSELKKSIAFLQMEQYYGRFKKLCHDAFAEIIAEGNQTAQRFNKINSDSKALKRTFNALMSNVLISSWKDVQEKVIEEKLAPYEHMVEAVVKVHAQGKLKDILAIVNDDLATISNLIGEYQKLADIFTLIEDTREDGIDNWLGGVKFGFAIGKKFYALLDEVIKNSHEQEKLKEDKEKLTQNIGLPEKAEPKEDIAQKIPAYTLDAAHLFVTATLFDTRHSVGEKGDYLSISACAFVANQPDIAQKEDDCKAEKGIYIIPTIHGTLNKDFAIGENHKLSIILEALLNDEKNPNKHQKMITDFRKGAVGVFISSSGVNWLYDEKKVTALATATVKRKPDIGALQIVKNQYLAFSIQDYPQSLAIGFKENNFYAQYKGAVEQANLKIKIREVNSFFATLLKDDIETKFGFGLLWSNQDGFSFEGHGTLKLDLDVKKKLSDILTIDHLIIEIGRPEGQDSGIAILVKVSFTIHFGSSITLSIVNLGIGSDIGFLKDDGSLGDYNFSPTFKFPTGIGVVIDTAVIQGVGAIAYFPEKEEFVGVLDIAIIDFIEAKAIALLTMKMPDGSEGYSFVGLISVYFNPGIPLGFGFTLSGLGGALGLNRNISTEAIENGVRDGSLGSVFFVENIDDNMGVMLNNLDTYFPIRKEQFFFGVLARISYTEMMNIEFGLLLTVPKPFKVIIVGGLHINLPSKSEALLRINAYFAGIIDFDHKILAFNASLVNSTFVFIDMYGDMALRLSWGEKKVFVLSAGGFHPAYKPDADMNLGHMRRLGLKVDYGPVKQRMETYFAVTSNTVQFGAEVDLYIGIGGAELFGYYGFDCLFHFSPFRFTASTHAGVKVKYKGYTLCAVSLSFQLSGPSQWNVNGTAKFKILWFSVSIHFNKTWGKKQADTQVSYINIYGLLRKEYQKIENWDSITTEKTLPGVPLSDEVTSGEELVLQPYSGIKFEQARVPLNTEIEHFGKNVRPRQYKEIRIAELWIGQSQIDHPENTQYDFAPSLYKELSDAEKLALPSYEKMDNGIRTDDHFKKREVSTCQVKEIAYKVDQDAISFSGNGYQITEKNKNRKLPKVSFEDLPNAIKGKGGNNLHFTSGSLTALLNNKTRRSPSGFQYYVTQIQQIQKEAMAEKANQFFKVSAGEYMLNFKAPTLHVALFKINPEGGFILNNAKVVKTKSKNEKSILRAGSGTKRVEIEKQPIAPQYSEGSLKKSGLSGINTEEGDDSLKGIREIPTSVLSLKTDASKQKTKPEISRALFKRPTTFNDAVKMQREIVKEHPGLKGRSFITKKN